VVVVHVLVLDLASTHRGRDLLATVDVLEIRTFFHDKPRRQPAPSVSDHRDPRLTRLVAPRSRLFFRAMCHVYSMATE